MISSSLRKWTSDFVGWTLTSTLEGSICRLGDQLRARGTVLGTIVTHLRYAQGEAPLGKNAVYIASMALRILLESTKRSVRQHGASPVRSIHLELTVYEQQPATLPRPVGVRIADPALDLCR